VIPTPHLGWYKPHIHRFNGEWRVSFAGYAGQDSFGQATQWANSCLGIARSDTALLSRPTCIQEGAK
jgi:hypothetical protein